MGVVFLTVVGTSRRAEHYYCPVVCVCETHSSKFSFFLFFSVNFLGGVLRNTLSFYYVVKAAYDVPCIYVMRPIEGDL